MIDFDKYAKEIHEQNKLVGWWDDPNRNVLETLQLVCTEIAEATEGERKDLMDDHLPHRKMGEVELADAMIRMLDIGGRCGFVLDFSRYDVGVNLTNDMVSHAIKSGHSIGALHFLLTNILTQVSSELEFDCSFDDLKSCEIAHKFYYLFLFMVFAIGKSQGYDIESTMIEKLEYNRQRADRKRENRAADGGKKF